ncbi:MAG: hypothetical protein QW835_03500 [Candidatus Hadarchaeum sp.]
MIEAFRMLHDSEETWEEKLTGELLSLGPIEGMSEFIIWLAKLVAWVKLAVVASLIKRDIDKTFKKPSLQTEVIKKRSDNGRRTDLGSAAVFFNQRRTKLVMK